MILSKDEPDLKEYKLPFNWMKQCKLRKAGRKGKKATTYVWDVYVTHEPSGKRFRSNVEINDYLSNNPEIKCNRNVTVCKYFDTHKAMHCTLRKHLNNSMA